MTFTTVVTGLTKEQLMASRDAFQKLMSHNFYFPYTYRLYEQYGVAELCDPITRGLRALHGRGRKTTPVSAGRYVVPRVLGPVATVKEVADTGDVVVKTRSVGMSTTSMKPQISWRFPQPRSVRRDLLNAAYRSRELTGPNRAERRRGVKAAWRGMVEVR